MSRLVDITATSTGTHHIRMGLNTSQLAGFSVQLWITRYGIRMIDWVQAMGLNFISFMGGDLWVHNDETVDRCRLFDEKRDCIVGVIANENPLKVKLLDSIGIHSDNAWEITSITIPATLNYPQGMSSKLPKVRFKKRNNVWQARFMRNLKTTSDTESVLDAIRGESLKGYQAYLVMKNTDNDQVKLFKVDINMQTCR